MVDQQAAVGQAGHPASFDQLQYLATHRFARVAGGFGQGMDIGKRVAFCRQAMPCLRYRVAATDFA